MDIDVNTRVLPLWCCFISSTLLSLLTVLGDGQKGPVLFQFQGGFADKSSRGFPFYHHFPFLGCPVFSVDFVYHKSAAKQACFQEFILSKYRDCSHSFWGFPICFWTLCLSLFIFCRFRLSQKPSQASLHQGLSTG